MLQHATRSSGFCAGLFAPVALSSRRQTTSCGCTEHRTLLADRPEVRSTSRSRYALRPGGRQIMIRALLTAPIRAYRYFLSPWLGNACRFTPTCSSYAIESIETWGPGRGSWLAVRRISRCHPWCREDTTRFRCVSPGPGPAKPLSHAVIQNDAKLPACPSWLSILIEATNGHSTHHPVDDLLAFTADAVEQLAGSSG